MADARQQRNNEPVGVAMFFGKSTFQSPKRELPRSVKRQIWYQALLLLFVVLLGLAIAGYLQRDVDQAKANRPPQDPSLEGVEEDVRVLLGPLAVSEAPEPFVERPEVLARAMVLDKTGYPDDGEVVLEEGVVYLFHRIRTAEKEYREEQPVLSVLRGDPVRRELTSNPAKYRGKLVEVRGNLFSASPREVPLRLRGLPPGNPSGLDRAFRSYVYDKNEPTYFLVYTFDKAREYSHLDDVTLRAYFYRLYTGESEVNGRLVPGTIPLLVGKNYDYLARPARGTTDIRALFPIVIVLTLIGAVVIFFVSYRTQKNYQARRAAGRRSVKGAET